MKKILIIVLLILILLLGGVWAYLLLNGAPENIADIRNNIFGTAPDVVPPTPGEPIDIPVEPLGSVRTVPTKALLTELTDRKVAGAVIVATTSGGFIRYMEKGTGNIFEISLDSGVESRISNQTIPYVVAAAWARTGDQVVFSTDIEGTRGETYFGTLTANDTGIAVFDAEIMDAAMENVAFSEDGEQLLYTTHNTSGNTIGFERRRKLGTTATLFSLPFSESTVLWDTLGASSSAHYAFTKPALGYMGFLYRIGKNDALTKIDDGSTLSALRSDAYLVINKDSGNGPYSLLINTKNGRSEFLTIETLKEKCDGSGPVIWCGASASENTTTFPIDWYQGAISYADQLWRINTETGTAIMVTDPEPIAREQIDITDLSVVEGGAHIIFRNKRNDSLWLYNPPQ